MSKKEVPSDLTESQLPSTIEDSVSRMNAVLMVCATSEVLEDETENVVEYYRDLMNRIQYLLRGYDFNGNTIPSVRETKKGCADCANFIRCNKHVENGWVEDNCPDFSRIETKKRT